MDKKKEHAFKLKLFCIGLHVDFIEITRKQENQIAKKTQIQRKKYIYHDCAGSNGKEHEQLNGNSMARKAHSHPAQQPLSTAQTLNHNRDPSMV